MLRLIRITVLLLALSGLIAACDDNGDGNENGDGPTATAGVSGEFPVTIESSNGESVTLDVQPQRIVSLSAGHTESLFAIGAGGQVVAVDNFSDFPAEAAAVEVKLDSFEPSAEAIANLDPDLVVLADAPEGFLDQLETLGVPAWLDELNSSTAVEDIFTSIETLGMATGHVDEAEAVVEDLQERTDTVVETVDEEAPDGPSVYHELDETLFAIGAESFTGDLYIKLDASNILDVGASSQLTQEAIITANPEVIILADAEFGQTPEVVAARPGWNAIAAVMNGRVYAIDEDIVSRPGPRIVDGLEELSTLIYPEIFPPEETPQ
jgi:iron complex transport system substrate-binding protein